MNTTQQRIARIRDIIAENELDALVVAIEENRRYLSDFKGEDHQFDESAGVLFITSNRLVLATDSRFETQARQEAPLYDVVVYRNGLAKELSALVNMLGCKKLGFESIRVSVEQYNNYKREIQNAKTAVDLVPVDGLVERLRMVKSEEEIELTKQALVLAEEAFYRLVQTLEPGITESALAWELEKGMREAGADAISFPVIIAASINSALPHAIPSQRIIRQGEPILFDWGAKLNGYCSDISRTLLLGKPDDTFLKVYGTVLEAQKRAIDAIKEGINAKDVDAIARNYIHDQGFEGKFGHSLGHGTGLAVHEGPRMGPIKDITLESGMIVTVEPGIYLPQWGGVRIENQVVVEKDGPRVLNRLKETYTIEQLM